MTYILMSWMAIFLRYGHFIIHFVVLNLNLNLIFQGEKPQGRMESSMHHDPSQATRKETRPSACGA